MTALRNPFAYDKPITPDSLDELFAHHRSLTGGWSMVNPPNPPNPPAPPADPPAPPPADPAPPSFEPITSQEDFDKRLGARIIREREKFADYEELKRKAAEFDAAQEANRTEQERAVEAARKEGETAATTRANARIVASEAKVLAAAAGAINPTTTARLLGDLSGITVSEDGTVDEAALKAKIDGLKETDPYLFGTPGPTPPIPPRPDPSQGGGGGGGSEKPGSIAEARQRAREERESKQGTKTA